MSLIFLLSCRLEEIMVVAARTRCRTIGVTSPCLLQDLRGKTRFTWRLGRNLHDVLLIKPVNMQKGLSIDYYLHQGDRCANISCTWYAHMHVLYIEKMLYRVMSSLVNIKSDKTQITPDNTLLSMQIANLNLCRNRKSASFANSK